MEIVDIKTIIMKGKARSPDSLRDPDLVLPPRRISVPFAPSNYSGSFTLIETDEGISGLSYGGYPLSPRLEDLLIGEDPLRVEYIWQQLGWRTFGYRRGLGRIELALWDIMGKHYGKPVYKVLGGPTREKLRAYAGMIGNSTDPEKAAKKAVKLVEKGFTGMKWYLSYNASHGMTGLIKNVELIKQVRDAVGYDIEIMVDCIISDPQMANSLRYALKLAKRLERYEPAWLEEPLNTQDLDAYSTLSKATSIPIALGEHDYDVWGIKRIIEKEAAMIVQPDISATGITEMRKIIALASANGLLVIPHSNESCRMNVHMLFAQTQRTCPLGEWGIKLNLNAQHFYKDFYEPEDGYFKLPNGPGFGYELDTEKNITE